MKLTVFWKAAEMTVTCHIGRLSILFSKARIFLDNRLMCPIVYFTQPEE